jgi:hypothetical protein
VKSPSLLVSLYLFHVHVNVFEGFGFFHFFLFFERVEVQVETVFFFADIDCGACPPGSACR